MLRSWHLHKTSWIDTVLPSMIVEAGGGAVHVGIMTAIIFGGSN